jgi:phosphate:Na+ symporter
VGTTGTAWILSLTGLEGDNFFIKLLKPTNFSLIFAVIGAIFFVFIKKGKKPNIGQILLGFAILFYGMSMMSDAALPLRDNEAFANLLLIFKNPVLGVMLGAAVTGILQSSTASIGILQALALSTALPFSVAFPIILGQNIGTCLTAILSSIGANKNAQRTAAVHLYYNILGAAVFLPVVYILNGIMQFSFWHDNVTAVTIASIHSVYNIACAVIYTVYETA